MMKYLGSIDKWLERITVYLLVLFLFLMLLFSLLTIVFRWLQITCLWFDPMVRHLVFACTFLGGVLATGRGTHIAIDILGRYFVGAKGKRRMARAINLVAVIILAIMIYASWNLVLVEKQYIKEVFLGIKSWQLVAIIPFGFFLICYRFIYRFLLTFQRKK